MEGDRKGAYVQEYSPLFQSTPSAWRETRTIVVPLTSKLISIHSLRMEGDGEKTRGRRKPVISIHSLRMEGDIAYLNSLTENDPNFNPLPPHGGRPPWHSE